MPTLNSHILMSLTLWSLLAGCEKTTPNQAPAPSSTPSTAPAAALKPAPYERQLRVAKAEASSFLEQEKGGAYTRYHPNYALDDNPATAWNEGAPSSGAAEWIKLPITKTVGVTKLRLRLKNGYQKPEKLFTQNARIKTLEIKLLPEGQTFTQTLPDSLEEQELSLSVEAKVVEAVQLTVIEVYEGSKFKDLCLSDLQLFATAEGPADSTAEDANVKTLNAWLLAQKEQSKVNKLLAKGELVYREETLHGVTEPFPPEAAEFIEKTSALFTSTKLVPVAFELNEAAPPSEQSSPGLECSCLRDCDSGDEFEEEEEEKAPAGAYWYAPCVDGSGNEGVSSLKLVKTKKPSADDCEVSLWSEPASLQAGAKVRAVLVKACSIDRSNEYSYDATQAVAFDSRGRLRAYVRKSYAGQAVSWFAWRTFGALDVLVGGIMAMQNKAGSIVSRLAPTNMTLPWDLEVPLPATLPAKP